QHQQRGATAPGSELPHPNRGLLRDLGRGAGLSDLDQSMSMVNRSDDAAAATAAAGAAAIGAATATTTAAKDSAATAAGAAEDDNGGTMMRKRDPVFQFDRPRRELPCRAAIRHPLLGARQYAPAQPRGDNHGRSPVVLN